MNFLQKLGKSLMLPVTIMPLAALLKGIGYWIDPLGWGVNNPFAAFLILSGGVVIDNLPILFAIAVAIGMTDKKNTTLSLAAVINYLMITKILSPEGISLISGLHISKVALAFHDTSNAFIGIIVGLIVAYCFKKFNHIELPGPLSFFNGERFIPIISGMITLLFAGIFMYVWPMLYETFIHFGTWMAGLGPISAGLYGFFNRLLIPTGLHHALNSVFWFNIAGINDIGRFWGTVSGGIKGITGMYQAGFFPVMMFGLPCGALAIYQSADKENRKKIGALMFSAALASFLTGITEPLEFSFMFLAPSLFVAHAIMTGIMMFIAASMHWLAGFSFSAGLIDYMLSFKAPFSYQAIHLIPLGIICGALYYVVFRSMILHFNLMTPGRMKEETKEVKTSLAFDYDDLAISFVEALGGRSNCLSADACITRLRLEVKDTSLINRDEITRLGFDHVVEAGEHYVQILVGTHAQFIADAMNDILM